MTLFIIHNAHYGDICSPVSYPMCIFLATHFLLPFCPSSISSWFYLASFQSILKFTSTFTFPVAVNINFSYSNSNRFLLHSFLATSIKIITRNLKQTPYIFNTNSRSFGCFINNSVDLVQIV